MNCCLVGKCCLSYAADTAVGWKEPRVGLLDFWRRDLAADPKVSEIDSKMTAVICRC